jgi:hypothetical protein
MMWLWRRVMAKKEVAAFCLVFAPGHRGARPLRDS